MCRLASTNLTEPDEAPFKAHQISRACQTGFGSQR